MFGTFNFANRTSKNAIPTCNIYTDHIWSFFIVTIEEILKRKGVSQLLNSYILKHTAIILDYHFL